MSAIVRVGGGERAEAKVNRTQELSAALFLWWPAC